MSTIMQGVHIVLSMMIMMGVGYVLTGNHWFEEEFTNTIVKVILNISMPLMMLNTITSNFEKSSFLSMVKAAIIPFIAIIICYWVSILFSNMLKIDSDSKGLYRTLFFNSNSIFMGLPINIALLGEVCVPYVLLYYIANTTCFWTLGISEISKDGAKRFGRRVEPIFSKEGFKKILSPSLFGYISGIILVLLGIKLPLFLQDSSKSLGGLTTPLSMIFIGCILYKIKFSDVKLDKFNVSILIGRFIISPGIMLILTRIIPIPQMMRTVFVIQSAMPTMTSSAIVAKSYGSDEKKAVVSIGLTTVIFLIALPFYIWILNM